MSSLSKVGVLSAALFLAACQVGPNYQKPETTLAPYHNAPVQAAEAPPLDQWWTGFHDAELTVIVDRQTGEIADPVLVDRKTGRAIIGADFKVTAGPAASDSMKKRYQTQPPNNALTESPL